MENVVDFLERFRSGIRETTPKPSPKQHSESMEECFTLFLKAAEEINKQYLPGTISFISRNHPDLDHEIDESESAVNSIWFAVEQDKSTVDELSAAVATWYRLNLKAIKIYSRQRSRQNELRAGTSANISLAETQK